MKKINLKSYEVDGQRDVAMCPKCNKEIPQLGGALLPKNCGGCGTDAVVGRVPAKVEINVKDHLCNLLYHPDLRLSASQVRERRTIEEEILAADGYVKLEEQPYNWLKAGMDVARGFTRSQQELISRVYDAEDVEVNPKHKKQAKHKK